MGPDVRISVISDLVFPTLSLPTGLVGNFHLPLLSLTPVKVGNDSKHFCGFVAMFSHNMMIWSSYVILRSMMPTWPWGASSAIWATTLPYRHRRSHWHHEHRDAVSFPMSKMVK